MDKNIHFAPVQGHTDAAYRHFHSSRYGGVDSYYTPFIRLEHGDIRQRDLRDAFGELTEATSAIPQLIFRDYEELSALTSRMKSEGAARIDINMGCPFPLQTGKGRGAGFLGNADQIAHLEETLGRYPELSYSVKMRLGYDDPQEWRGVMPVLNRLELRHIDVHPRVARQQYGGELHMDQFADLLAESRNPVVFNGELRTPADMRRVMEEYPGVAGLMIARGVLGRPSLAAEYAEGREWSRNERISEMLRFHRLLLDHYTGLLCGDSQLLSKIKPFWEYAEEEIGRKAWKAIKKATNIAKYHSAVALVRPD